MSKRIATWRGVIHCENFDERRRVDAGDAGLLLELADGGEPVRRVALALVRVDRAAGEDPDAAHEARLRRAPHEQQLERRVAAAQHDHRRGLARDGGLARTC